MRSSAERCSGAERRRAVQSGAAERSGAERRRSARSGAERNAVVRSGAKRRGPPHSRAERRGAARRSGAKRPGSWRRGAERRRVGHSGPEWHGVERSSAITWRRKCRKACAQRMSHVNLNFPKLTIDQSGKHKKTLYISSPMMTKPCTLLPLMERCASVWHRNSKALRVSTKNPFRNSM